MFFALKYSGLVEKPKEALFLNDEIDLLLRIFNTLVDLGESVIIILQNWKM